MPSDAQARLLRRFLDALAADDRDGLLALFSADATFTSDGGGKVRAARNVLDGPDRITRLLLGLEAKFGDYTVHDIVMLNGMPAILTLVDERAFAATSFATDGQCIIAVYRVLNPDKLRGVTSAYAPLA